MARLPLALWIADVLAFAAIVVVSGDVDAGGPGAALAAAASFAALNTIAKPWFRATELPAGAARLAFAVFGGVLLTLELLSGSALALGRLGLGRAASTAVATVALVTVYALLKPRLLRLASPAGIARGLAWLSGTILALALTDGLLAGVRLAGAAALLGTATIVWAVDLVVAAVALAPPRRRALSAAGPAARPRSARRSPGSPGRGSAG